MSVRAKAVENCENMRSTGTNKLRVVETARRSGRRVASEQEESHRPGPRRGLTRRKVSRGVPL